MIDINYKDNVKQYLHQFYTTAPKEQIKALRDGLGIGESTFRRWANLNDTNGPTLDILPKLCALLDITLYQLFQIEDPSHLSDEESKIINEYRKQESMQQAVKNVLGIKD